MFYGNSHTSLKKRERNIFTIILHIVGKSLEIDEAIHGFIRFPLS